MSHNRGSRTYPSGQRRGPKLPLELQEKFGLNTSQSNGHRPRYGRDRGNSRGRGASRGRGGRGGTNSIADRREQRKSERYGARQERPAKRRKVEDVGELGMDNDEDEDEPDLTGRDYSDGSDEDSVMSPEPLRPVRKPEKNKPREPEEEPYIPPEDSDMDDIDSLDEQIARFREQSPEMNLDATSRTFMDRDAQDDDEILALERKLGMKSGGKSKEEVDDGFDDVLGGLEGRNAGALKKSGKSEEQKWLESKRRKSHANNVVDGEDKEDESVMGSGDDISEEEANPNEDGDDFFGFDSEDEQVDGKSKTAQLEPRQRENPYKAPISESQATGKYIPPSMRQRTQAQTEDLTRLRRQAQGSLNKLSEANLISIVGEFEKLYQVNPRQDVTTVIIEHILAAFTIKSALLNTFILLHGAFISALYKVLGSDFGAETICKLVEAFDQYHNNDDGNGKESLNILGLLANLFTFGVVSSSIIYDHIRLLLGDFGENSAELLLRVVRDCGPQLRADDPTALKGIVALMNTVTADMTKRGEKINVRTRVMIDMIDDLKNNRTRQATNSAGATGEHLTRMRKALGSLNNRQLRGTEPLNITRDDIANSDKKGKWWLVGASWKGNLTEQNRPGNMLPETDAKHDEFATEDFDEINYDALASHYRMNTPARRGIFVAIMSAVDAQDCLMRLSKLRLTRKQEPEIARVLVRCCRAEPVYNPYYAVVARKLLVQDSKRYRMSFMIALWKFFESLGEKSEDAEGSEEERDSRQQNETVDVKEIHNTAKMYARLVLKQVMQLDLLKTLNIGMTKEDASLFLELFLITILVEAKSDAEVEEVCHSVPPHILQSLQYFLRKVVAKSDLVEKKDRILLKERVKLAGSVLHSAAVDEDDQ